MQTNTLLLIILILLVFVLLCIVIATILGKIFVAQKIATTASNVIDSVKNIITPKKKNVTFDPSS